jgi:predicted ester cyclase
MDSNQNKEIFRRVVEEAFNNAKYQVLPELFHPDFIEHQFGFHATIPGMQADIEYLRETFPDFHVTIEDLTVDRDMVWARSTARGTNTVGFMGPPNGKSFQITVYDSVRIRDGKIAEHWGSPDRFAMMAQLGLLPQTIA